MDIVSYLLGKESGGGSSALQSKEVEITENGETTITPDTGYDGLSNVKVTTNVSGNPEPIEKDVNFYDYDGTRVYSYTAQEFLALDSMPANPTHDGLTAQGWNWDLSDAKTQVTQLGALDVGQMYITSDGKTRVYININTTGTVYPYLALYINGSVTVDWGDGSATDTMTGTSDTETIVNKKHTYSKMGNYVITITPSENTTFTFASYNGISLLISATGNSSSASSSNHNYDNFRTLVQKIEIGSGVNSISNDNGRLYGLKTITMPSSITSIGTGFLANSYNIEYITVPKNITQIKNNFGNQSNLKNISIPKITSIGDYFTSNICNITLPYTLTTIGNYFKPTNRGKVVIPNSVTSVGTYFQQNNNVVTEVIVSENLTTIPDYFIFSSYSVSNVKFLGDITQIGTSMGNFLFTCYSIDNVYFGNCTSVPTLTGSFAANVNRFYKIIVPDNLFDEWKTASGWSTYSSKIMKKSDWEALQ